MHKCTSGFAGTGKGHLLLSEEIVPILQINAYDDYY